jgi:hypothetical protein
MQLIIREEKIADIVRLSKEVPLGEKSAGEASYRKICSG